MAGPQVASFAEGSGWTGPQIACMVNTEINQVMAVMRQNARWAVAPRYLVSLCDRTFASIYECVELHGLTAGLYVLFSLLKYAR